MRTLSLRDFQQHGVASLPPGAAADPLLLSGRHDQFFLVPVGGEDVGRQYEALRQALAILSIRQTQLKAREAGLDQMSMADIEAEIRAARAERRSRKAGK
jgi:hypothetical protein